MRMRADLSNLFASLGQAGIHRLDMRDILCAAAGMKVSRIAATDETAALVKSLVEPYGVSVVLSDSKYVSIRDSGKGAWSNRCKEAPADSPDGTWHMFLATDVRLAQDAQQCQKRNDHDSLGRLLGIPDCCRNFFCRFSKLAAQKDLLPFILRNTDTAKELNFWTNYGVRYFGYSLLSFAPCSFSCSHAAATAKKVFSILASINSEFADGFIEYQKRSVFYTEESGVFLLQARPASANRISFQTLRMTTDNSPVANAMRKGNSLEIGPGGDVLIFNNEELLLTASGESCALCVFAS